MLCTFPSNFAKIWERKTKVWQLNESKYSLQYFSWAYISHFEKMWNVGLWDYLALFMSVFLKLCIPLINSECLNESLWNFVCTSRNLSPSQRQITPIIVYVYVCVSLLGRNLEKTFLRQRIHAITEELFDASFSMQSFSYQRRVYG